MFEAQDHGLLVRCLDLLDLAEAVRSARVHPLEHLHDAVLHVGAGERMPVVKLDSLAELELSREAVLAHRPGLSEAWLRIEVEVVLEQARVGAGAALAHRRRGTEIGRQGRHLGLNEMHQRPALLGGGGCLADRGEAGPRDQDGRARGAGSLEKVAPAPVERPAHGDDFRAGLGGCVGLRNWFALLF